MVGQGNPTSIINDKGDSYFTITDKYFLPGTYILRGLDTGSFSQSYSNSYSITQYLFAGFTLGWGTSDETKYGIVKKNDNTDMDSSYSSIDITSWSVSSSRMTFSLEIVSRSNEGLQLRFHRYSNMNGSTFVFARPSAFYKIYRFE